MVSHWANHFCGGCVNIDNDPRPGRPRTLTDETSVKLVADALEKDCCATCEELLRAMRVPATSVFHTLTNDLNKRKISARWIPHCLTTEHKKKHLDIATLLKERFYVGDQTILCRIVAIAETWIRDFEPELKFTVQLVESYRFPSARKMLTSSIKGYTNDDLCL